MPAGTVATAPEAKRENARDRAWNLKLSGKLNTRYWPALLAKTKAAKRNWQTLIVCTGIASAAIVAASGWEWPKIAASVLVNILAAILAGYSYDNTISERKRYVERWMEFAHDSDILWQDGEKLGWGREDCIRRLIQLTERERNHQAQELDVVDRPLVTECQRELWTELGVPYD